MIQAAGFRYIPKGAIKVADKQSAEERALLKGEAFKWAPSQGAWQRQLTANGIRAAKRVIAELTKEV